MLHFFLTYSNIEMRIIFIYMIYKELLRAGKKFTALSLLHDIDSDFSIKSSMSFEVVLFQLQYWHGRRNSNHTGLKFLKIYKSCHIHLFFILTQKLCAISTKKNIEIQRCFCVLQTDSSRKYNKTC